MAQIRAAANPEIFAGVSAERKAADVIKFAAEKFITRFRIPVNEPQSHAETSNNGGAWRNFRNERLFISQARHASFERSILECTRATGAPWAFLRASNRSLNAGPDGIQDSECNLSAAINRSASPRFFQGLHDDLISRATSCTASPTVFCPWSNTPDAGIADSVKLEPMRGGFLTW
ncbi:hypothetical protein KM043_006832 [Ampulex compressa]|nr:hypothetical protein KM043_006832 [Ampulex compressa]